MITGAILLLLWLNHASLLTSRTLQQEQPDVIPLHVSNISVHKPLPCRNLPGADDTLVILKTGSTEFQEKLPVHLSTTLRCYPHRIIFSDYEENYAGHQIFDALESVSSSIKETHPDFALWRRLKVEGRKSLQQIELSGVRNNDLLATGNIDNPGWKLDKWKFLPMINRTLHEHPNKKWYVFVEADTYIFWQTLLVYLSQLDSTKPYYMGSQNWIGDIAFGHGGSGFVASRPALEGVVAHYQAHKQEWEDFTAGHWAGDCVLGKAFQDSGTPLTHAWPILQGASLGEMHYDREDENPERLWCRPTVSYHHLTPAEIQRMWYFEQNWITKTNDSTRFLRHKDVFETYILPLMSTSSSQAVYWDNRSSDDEGHVDSFDECRDRCENKESCLQCSFQGNEQRCLTSSRPSLGGVSVTGVNSGWLADRMRRFHDEAEVCGEEGWIY